jgi:pimeloyl-ACP methyl ester carboxylesterase
MVKFKLGWLVLAGVLAGCTAETETFSGGTGGSGGAGQAGVAGASGEAGQGGSSAGAAGESGSAGDAGATGAGTSGQAGEGGAGQAGEAGAGGDAGTSGADPGGAGGVAGQGGAGGGAGGGAAFDPEAPPAVELSTWKGKLTPGFQGLDIVVTWPKGASSKMPLVLFAHGFQLGVSDYDGTLQHLARFGYVVASVDYASNFLDQDHYAPVDSMKLAIDLLTKTPPAEVGAVADADKIVAMGHSLGAKGAIWAALDLPQIKALIALDPVDDNPSPFPLPPPQRPSRAPEQMGNLKAPALYFGAQLSSTGFQACAPKGSDACSFAASTPAALFSRHYTLEQFGHMQFLDNSSCLSCSACPKGPAPQEAAGRAFVRAQSVAFLEAQLKGNLDALAYLESSPPTASGANVIFDGTEQQAFCKP